MILVGGQGTRLRPLTERIRKDMLSLVDRPLLAFTFEHLRGHGVRRGIVSCGYLPTQIKEHFGSAYGDLDLTYRVESEPLGTAGGIAYAAGEIGETFFALNGDSLRGADLGEMVRFHRETGAKATILLTPVADPTRYGLVRLAPDGRVSTFLEKPRPEEIDTNLINAGLYVLEPEVLELVAPGGAVSIERDVFPKLASEGSVYGIALDGYWLDVGTPESYLQAHRDVLERSFSSEIGEALGPDFTLVDPGRQGPSRRTPRTSGLRRPRSRRGGRCARGEPCCARRRLASRSRRARRERCDRSPRAHRCCDRGRRIRRRGRCRDRRRLRGAKPRRRWPGREARSRQCARSRAADRS